MMPDDELCALAESIKNDGQIHPIVLGEWKDQEGEKVEGLVDGRNRLRACEIAGVEPQFSKLNGQDPVAFIAAVNLSRRNLSGGQKAMAMAMMFPETGKRGRGNKNVQELNNIHKGRLSIARAVLAASAELAKAVMGNVLSLEAAHEETKRLHTSRKSDEAKMVMLRSEARDLADLVSEERMTLNEAIAALQDRNRKTTEQIEHGKQAANAGLSRFLADVASIIAASKLTEERLLDKKRVAAVVKAAEQLQSLI
jgi:hypothetical protein